VLCEEEAARSSIGFYGCLHPALLSETRRSLDTRRFTSPPHTHSRALQQQDNNPPRIKLAPWGLNT